MQAPPWLTHLAAALPLEFVLYHRAVERSPVEVAILDVGWMWAYWPESDNLADTTCN